MTDPLLDSADESTNASGFDSLELAPTLVAGLKAMEITDPTPVQVEAIVPILRGVDVVALAPTGTGKTVAFGVAMLQLILASKRAESTPKPRGGRRQAPRRPLRGLVLCPTRELAIQVGKELSLIAARTSLRVETATGKTALSPQIAALAEGVDVLVATPGRVRELVEAGALELAVVRHVTIDEADRMLDLGFLPQVREILQRMAPDRQVVLTSATMPPTVDRLVAEMFNHPVTIELAGHSAVATHVRQRLFEVDDITKVRLLLALLAEPPATSPQGRRGRAAGGTIIFCRTRRRAGWISAALSRHGLANGTIHADRSHAQRLRALDSFVSGRTNLLVATDVAARGLHLERLERVINYDVPILTVEYVHRAGRAGHGGDHGESITLVSPGDRSRWTRIERLLGIAIDPEPLPASVIATLPTGRRREAERAAAAAAAEGADAPATEPTKQAKKARRTDRGGSPAKGSRKSSVKRTGKRVDRDKAKGAGKLKRRLSRRRTIDKSQKPGRGVR